MSNYHDGLLPEPCLRMDTHFGDEYESVEFGDGTGYVKAEPTLARLGALHVELDELRDENAKLCEVCAELLEMAESHDPEWFHWPEMHEELRKLGVKVV